MGSFFTFILIFLSSKVSLRSLLMEDLLQPPESKHRSMLVSSSADNQSFRPGSAYSSRSCPNLIGLHFPDDGVTGSLPENLESGAGFSNYLNPSKKPPTNHQYIATQHKVNCPETPPPSPQRRMRQDNLVLYSALIVDPNCPNFVTKYNSMRQTSSIDFNSLDLIISVKSWFAFLNFFGLISDNANYSSSADETTNTTVESTSSEPDKDNSELEVSVRSLTLVFVRTDYEIGKANVSNAHFILSKFNDTNTVKGRLGSMSLFDLTVHGSIYRERFLTSGNEALNFVYTRDDPKKILEKSLNPEATLNIKMSSVRYVHTKRFVAEIQSFVYEFQQLQTSNLFRKIKQHPEQKAMQLALSIKAGSPIVLLPLSSKSNKVIVADLGEFSLENSFHFASETGHVISVRKDENGPNEILDVMLVDLVNTDLFAGERYPKIDDNADINISLNSDSQCMDMGSYIVCKKGANLLNGKCHLKLIVERNLETWRSHNVPDFSVQGTLSRLEVVLNLQQYQLVRGFLQYNLGEPLDDLNMISIENITDSRYSLSNENILNNVDEEDTNTWTSMSITLDLQDVSVRLKTESDANSSGKPKLYAEPIVKFDRETSLACINFIKSSLKIDLFSDSSQDIDLVSQEILVTDSRFNENHDGWVDATGRKLPRSIFTNILQPIKFKSGGDSVQAEIHSRKRQDNSKYTILLNNMRVMVILDWMETVKDFLSQDCDEIVPQVVNSVHKMASMDNVNIVSGEMEVILNVTNSELIFVEKLDQWDTNAIILKSTTVLSYRPAEVNKVMSINLNHLEVFSCILGLEEDTALSIIDPITVNMDLKQNTLDIQLQKRLCIRLSYNDVKMFMRMIESLPNQTRNALTKENKQYDQILIDKLSILGFSKEDCIKALEICNNILDDSALWLTQNAEPVKQNVSHTQGLLDIHAIQIFANCISICVIDDCKDADVPLLELSFSETEFRQEFGSSTEYIHSPGSSSNLIRSNSFGTRSNFKAGYLKGVFGSDYYNRVLSGWEPLVEPWKFESQWSYSLGASIQPNRLNLRINSEDLFKINITTTIIELFNLVYENWTQDYYGGTNRVCAPSPTKDMANNVAHYRRRNPFVPFALKNKTGVRLTFTTFVSTAGDGISKVTDVLSPRTNSQQWITVEPGEVVPFSFGPTHKQRHYETHKLNLHQVGVRVEGWSEVGPVSVDKVGVFFRYARHELAEFVSLPRARIVFSVTLEGSAQKLVTVRSALRVVNKLDKTMLLKMEHLNTVNYPDAITAIINPSEIYSVPLSHVNAHLYLVPVQTKITFTSDNSTASTNEESGSISSLISRSTERNDGKLYFCERSIHWRDMDEGMNIQQWYRTCKINRDKYFRVVASIRRDGYPIKDFGTIPGHTIVLLPPLRLHNFLPCDLLYRINSATKGRISPSETANIYEIDLENQIELILTLDNYPGTEKFIIPSGHSTSNDYCLRLRDTKNRPLLLRASIQATKGSGLQITISAPYWLINRTGLPLIFRQEGVSMESSGQFTENEQARLVSPLMFSFSDPEASPALTVRLGKRYGPSPPWCPPFNLQDKDILHQQLQSGTSNETFVIGVEVRCGKGRYSRTRVVTFSPRFQLYNRCSYKLEFAQKCYANSSVSFYNF